ncbi:unnamed protein product [Calypogeia fissa]
MKLFHAQTAIPRWKTPTELTNVVDVNNNAIQLSPIPHEDENFLPSCCEQLNNWTFKPGTLLKNRIWCVCWAQYYNIQYSPRNPPALQHVASSTQAFSRATFCRTEGRRADTKRAEVSGQGLSEEARDREGERSDFPRHHGQNEEDERGQRQRATSSTTGKTKRTNTGSGRGHQAVHAPAALRAQ